MMKGLIKRVLTVICAVGVMSAYTGIIASAAPTPRPMPGSAAAKEAAANTNEDEGSYSVSTIDENRTRTNTSDAVNYVASSENGSDEDEGEQESNPEQDNSLQPPTVIPVNVNNNNEAVPQAPEETPAKEKSGVSMGAVFLWFLAAIIINAVISFWVGNRFYKLAKKDTHVTAEIRALRRDVEEKFISNVGGFTEMENEISNSNEDYSMDEEGIKMPERKARENRGQVVSDGFEEDAFRKWESRQAEAARVQAEREQPKKSIDQTQRVSMNRIRERGDQSGRETRKKQYQPNRRTDYDASFDDDSNDETKRVKKGQSVNNVKNKAKEFLGDIFPFKED